jgi:hypothetical protein
MIMEGKQLTDDSCFWNKGEERAIGDRRGGMVLKTVQRSTFNDQRGRAVNREK